MATSYNFDDFNGINSLNIKDTLPQNSFTGLPSTSIGKFSQLNLDNSSVANQPGSLLDWFKNFNNLQALMSGLQSIGGLYNAYNMNKLAKKQFQFTKDFAQENLNNQVQTYNNSKEDLAAARFASQNPNNPSAAQRSTEEYMGKQALRKKEF